MQLPWNPCCQPDSWLPAAYSLIHLTLATSLLTLKGLLSSWLLFLVVAGSRRSRNPVLRAVVNVADLLGEDDLATNSSDDDADDEAINDAEQQQHAAATLMPPVVQQQQQQLAAGPLTPPVPNEPAPMTPHFSDVPMPQAPEVSTSMGVSAQSVTVNVPGVGCVSTDGNPSRDRDVVSVGTYRVHQWNICDSGRTAQYMVDSNQECDQSFMPHHWAWLEDSSISSSLDPWVSSFPGPKQFASW